MPIDPYVYRYTSASLAQELIETQLYWTTDRAHYGYGMYATDIPPEDRSTLEEVMEHCYAGEMTEVELQWCLHLWRKTGTSEELWFEEVAPHNFLIPRDGPGERVELYAMLAGASRWTGTEWVEEDID